MTLTCIISKLVNDLFLQLMTVDVLLFCFSFSLLKAIALEEEQ
jgi:hypothetical protein